jgi:hypothetical protein
VAVMFPRKIPQSVFDDPLKDAEAKTYRALRDTLSDDYSVFYSVAWLAGPGNPRTGDGEADFVILHPERGLLILEVKGGGISRDGPNGQWYTRDRHENYHRIKDPVNQARENKYALLKKLQNVPGLGHVFFPLAHGVVFPHSQPTVADLGTDAPSPLFGFSSHMGELGTRVEAMFDFWNQQEERPVKTLSPAEIERIEQTLAKSFELRYSLAAIVEEDDAELVSLTQEQYSLLGFLGPTRRALVSGGAGTGKTMLAIEKARRLASEGFRVLFTCYNRPLADHLATSCEGVDRLDVMSFHQLCRRFVTKAKIKVAGNSSSSEYFNELPNALIQALDIVDTRYDAIVVDEGQDFEATWWDALQFCMADPVDGVLYVFTDPNQAIYGDPGEIPGALPPFHLTQNVRNTRSIHSSVIPYYDGPAFTPLGPAGQPIERVVAEGDTAISRSVGRLLHRYAVEESIDRANIVVLSGAGQGGGALRIGDEIGNFELAPPSEQGPGLVGYETVRRFKGLERQVVILVDIDAITSSDELSYVALTRARSLLALVGPETSLDRLLGA